MDSHNVNKTFHFDIWRLKMKDPLLNMDIMLTFICLKTRTGFVLWICQGIAWNIIVMIDSEVNIPIWLFSQFFILFKSLIFLVIEFFVAYHYRNEKAFMVNLTYISKIAFL